MYTTLSLSLPPLCVSVCIDCISFFCSTRSSVWYVSFLAWFLFEFRKNTKKSIEYHRHGEMRVCLWLVFFLTRSIGKRHVSSHLFAWALLVFVVSFRQFIVLVMKMKEGERERDKSARRLRSAKINRRNRMFDDLSSSSLSSPSLFPLSTTHRAKPVYYLKDRDDWATWNTNILSITLQLWSEGNERRLLPLSDWV